jgi:Leucine-rich repeat (LRR) protein
MTPLMGQTLTASRFSSEKPSSPSDEALKNWANESAWQETFVFLFERLASKDRSGSEGLFNHLFHDRLENDPEGRESPRARLMAELTADNFVLLSGAVRRTARRQCWKWVFQRTRDQSTADYPHQFDVGSSVVHLLLTEQKGDLGKAWRSAELEDSELQALVERLDLSGCTDLLSLDALVNLKKLERLSIRDCKKINDVTPLNELENLAVLNLSGCENITDLSPLRGLVKLSELSLDGCKPIDLQKPLDSSFQENPH